MATETQIHPEKIELQFRFGKDDEAAQKRFTDTLDGKPALNPYGDSGPAYTITEYTVVQDWTDQVVRVSLARKP